MNRFKNGLCLMAALYLVASPSSRAQFSVTDAGTVDGPTLFQRIHNLRIKLQPDNSEENGFLYMMNTPNNLHRQLQFFQMMPNDAASTTLHIWALPDDVKAHPELLGVPSPFPQMWVRYHGDAFVEAGASHVDYPANFQIDSNANPNLIYDFADKTVTLPQ